MIRQLDAVAEATELSEAERWAEAAVRWREVTEANPVHGTHWESLAEACFASGDAAGALVAYEQALRFGVMAPRETAFPAEIRYRMARCHARLGDGEQARAAVVEAVRLGLRDPDRTAGDEDLGWLFEPPGGAAPGGPAAVDRVDGWRSDLHLLAAEIRRRAPCVPAGFDPAVATVDGALSHLDDARIVVEFCRLLRMLGDGHARIDVTDAYPHWRNGLPTWFYLFAEGLFVTEVDTRYAHLLGAEVLAFDGHPLSDALLALDPLLAQDNEYGAMEAAPRWLRLPVFLHALGIADDPGKVTLTVRLAGGTVADVPIVAEPTAAASFWQHTAPPTALHLPDTLDAATPAYLRDRDRHYWFAHEPADRLVYFQFNSIAAEPGDTLDACYTRVLDAVDAHDVDRLVVDLRWNGGGNTFLALPLVHHVIRRPRIDQPGRLFVLIGRHTFSAAQNTASFFERHTRATFVGEPTGSSPNFVGETAPFRLPYSRLRANVSDLFWQGSWPMDHRVAIPPDIYAPPTFAAYRANRDPAMDAILGRG